MMGGYQATQVIRHNLGFAGLPVRPDCGRPPDLRLAGRAAVATIAAMSAPPDPGLLYTALMLRKLHELRSFGRVLDAGGDGRYPAVLAEHLPGARWIGAEEAWAPVLDGLRLRRRDGGVLALADIRGAAAAIATVDLALFDEGAFAALEPGEVRALLAAWMDHAPLVLAELPAGTMAPGLAARFGAVCLFTADTGRARQVTQLHAAIPAIVRRLTEAGA